MKRLSIISILLLAVLFSGTAQDKSKKDKKAKAPEFITTPSGLQYAITKKGTGVKAAPGDKVTVHYTGKLTNDTVFDSSVKKNQPFSFKLGASQVIKGWDEGIALLHIGDKAILRIPPELGYGSQATGIIPANSILIFEVELIDASGAPRPYDVKGKDTITTASGLKYILVKENKDGIRAKSGEKVSVHYTGFLTDGKVFDSSVERGRPFEFPVGKSKVIRGWDEAFVLLRKGEKARIIIPSNLGYGERGTGPIPANATLIFDVEMLDIMPRILPKPYDVVGKDTLKTSTGLKYIIASKNNSAIKAGAGKQVAVHYTGYLADGSMFESSLEGGQPIQFALGQNMVIPGWEEGISLMSMGDKYRLIIPSNLAYGDQGLSPIIPPNAVLIFDVELLLVTDVPPKAAQPHDHSDPNHKH